MRVPADGEFRLDDEAATARMGRAIAAILEVGEAVCLTGPLGAGKSVLARALVRALSPMERDVPSPTYTLAQFYEGARFPIVHFDLYRLTSADEAFELGVAEALSDGAAVIEWAERLGHHLPPDRLDVAIEIAGEARRARLSAEGRWEGRALEL
jgi:tRNA threonylcarbamoyladenosine biosynthesis protein TsaE